MKKQVIGAALAFAALAMLILAGPSGDAAQTRSDVPKNAIVFFNRASCPRGFEAFVAAEGRYVTGMPAGGTLAGTSGTALSDLESRSVGQHTHGVTDPGHGHSNSSAWADLDDEFDAAPGGTANRAVSGDFPTLGGVPSDAPGAASVANATTGVTIQDAGAVAGTNAPYVQLMACRKR